jgi:uncharacterized protein (TIGR03663 family)
MKKRWPVKGGTSDAKVSPDLSQRADHWDRWVPWAILLVAVVLRVWALEIKPPHFDEGINGWFADRMKQTGFYQYDPTNYHGPLYFYAVYAGQILFGREVWALRLPAILAGVGAVWLLLRLGRRWFPREAVWLAAGAMAVSPAMVFYGRYSIHETTLLLFNILFFFGVLGLWRRGQAEDFYFLVVGVVGMVLTKETYLIQIGTVLPAFACLWIWQQVVRCSDGGPQGKGGLRPARWQVSWRQAGWVMGWGIFALVFFYSGNFFHWSGLNGLWQTYAAWFETGMKSGGHEKTAYDLWGPLNWYWLALMGRYEWFALAGVIGAVLCVRPVSAVLRFTAIYGVGVLLAYSIVAYKTPWCILALMWPFFLVGPAVVAEWKSPGWVRPVFGLVLLGFLAVDLGRSLRLNFRDHSDPTEPYVYVQTFPEVARLTGPILEKARRDALGYEVRGEIYLASYYPLPWILGDFTKLAYWGDKTPPKKTSADFVVIEAARADEVRKVLEGDYVEREFRLREAQEPCVVFLRRETYGDLLAEEEAAGQPWRGW